MQKTAIEYLDRTWNPLAMRCVKVSSGCDHCWHLRMAARMAGNRALGADRRAAYAGGPPVLLTKELVAPLRLSTPSVIGVQFMGDLFLPTVDPRHIRAVFGVMAAASQHLFLVLTKRPQRMFQWFKDLAYTSCPWTECHWAALQEDDPAETVHRRSRGGDPDVRPWPLPNVLLGVSVEEQRFVSRIVDLQRVPAAGRFVSVEPQLGKVVLPDGPLDLVVCGGETGSGARPMMRDWARDLRDQSHERGAAFFFKQLGSWSKAADGGTLGGKVYHEWPEAFLQPRGK